MKDWVWLDRAAIVAIHNEQLEEHGGGAGLRDAGLLESVLNRQLNLAANGSPNAADLAASCAVVLAKNHPFVDGNKRTAFIAMELFLTLNGFRLTADHAECVVTMLSVAAGEIDEANLGDWIRQNGAVR